MIFPSLAALCAALRPLAQNRPRRAFWIAFGTWIVVRATLDRHHTFFEALFEPASLFGVLGFAILGAVLFLPAVRQRVVHARAYRRARSVGETADATPWSPTELELALDLGHTDRAVDVVLRRARAHTAPEPFENPIDLAPIRDQFVDAGDDPSTAGRTIASSGMSALELPSDLGGVGADIDQIATAVRVVSSYSPTLAAALAQANLASALALVLRYGSEDQRRALVPTLTSRDGAASIHSTPVSNQQDGLTGRILDLGSDRQAVELNGTIADVPVLAPPSHIVAAFVIEVPTGDVERIAVIPVDAPGARLSIEPAQDEAPSRATLELHDVHLDAESLLGTGLSTGTTSDILAMASGTAACVATPALASGWLQAHARAASAISAVRGEVDAHALARVSSATLQATSLARAFAKMARFTIPTATEADAAQHATRLALTRKTAANRDADPEGAAPDRRALVAALALFDAPTQTRRDDALCALSVHEVAAAHGGGTSEFDRVRAAHTAERIARALRWVARSWTARRWMRRRRPPVESRDALSLACEAYATASDAAAAAALRGHRSAMRDDALAEARGALIGAICVLAMYEADGRQATERVFVATALCDATEAALDALDPVGRSLHSRSRRWVTRHALGVTRRVLARTRPDDENVAAAMTRDTAATERLTRDVDSTGSLAAWERAASAAAKMRVPLAQISQARRNGQLPETDDAVTLHLAVDRGLISDRDRELIEAGWQAFAAVLPGRAEGERTDRVAS